VIRQMMTDPLTPPPELVQQWLCSDDYPWGPLEQTSITITANRLQNVATQAAQWGADKELAACIEWIAGRDWTWTSAQLRTARRPKPPSLKEQALEELGDAYDRDKIDDTTYDIIRRALEALDD
jgi:hypothetical protein